jgi:hypothetical protein
MTHEFSKVPYLSDISVRCSDLVTLRLLLDPPTSRFFE